MLVRCQALALSLCSPSLLKDPHTLWSRDPLEPPKHPSTLPATLQLRGVPNSHGPWLRLCGPPGAPAGSFTLSIASSLALLLSCSLAQLTCSGRLQGTETGVGSNPPDKFPTGSGCWGRGRRGPKQPNEFCLPPHKWQNGSELHPHRAGLFPHNYAPAPDLAQRLLAGGWAGKGCGGPSLPGQVPFPLLQCPSHQ